MEGRREICPFQERAAELPGALLKNGQVVDFGLALEDDMSDFVVGFS